MDAENFHQMHTQPAIFLHIKQLWGSLLPISLKFIRKNLPKSLSFYSPFSLFFQHGAVKFHLFIFFLNMSYKPALINDLNDYHCLKGASVGQEHFRVW